MFIFLKIHNFDPETEASVFNTEEEARKYLESYWEDYYNAEIAECSDLVEGECYHEDDFAKIEWADGCQTWFYIIEATPPRNIK